MNPHACHRAGGPRLLAAEPAHGKDWIVCRSIYDLVRGDKAVSYRRPVLSEVQVERRVRGGGLGVRGDVTTTAWARHGEGEHDHQGRED